jgi:transposase InsO family protein
MEQPAQINLSGDSKKVPITVEAAAQGSTIVASIPLDLTLEANVEVVLNSGAEETTLGHRITGDRSGRRHRSGWEILHVAIDDAARLAYSEILPDEKRASAIAFLDRARAWFGRHGVTVERVMTDNGSAYRSHAFRHACADAGLRHLRTRPYTPRTNGKAERFIQTALREWAYARPYASSSERSHAITTWLHQYNHHRPHAGIHAATPIARLNNLLGNDS